MSLKSPHEELTIKFVLYCIVFLVLKKKILTFKVTLIHLAPVVRKEDSAIHWINYYPLDSAISCRNAYPLNSNLSGG